MDFSSKGINPEAAINQRISDDVLSSSGLILDIKRCDLIHPEVSGNKWYKLKYNLEAAISAHHKTMLSFGGAYSNHISAVAAAGKMFGIKTIGIIRGEEPATWSPTLKFAKECGMQLEFISRLAYAEKETEDFKSWLHEEYGSFHLVPEGGSNFLGVNGCMEILTKSDLEFYDVVCCASGTGATAAGLLLSSGSYQKIISFPVLAGGDFIKDEIKKHLQFFLVNDEVANDLMKNLEMKPEYHFGGYAKWNSELIEFIRQFGHSHSIPLDQVYTGKLMYGVMDLIRKGEFNAGTKILVIHSGGLQGRIPELV